MVDPVFSDVAVTWLGAAGCVAYFHFLWRQRQGSASAPASLFLFGTMAVLLAVRGLYWLLDEPAHLGRAVFATATLLPIAVSVYTEHLLRRHHPLALKLGALAVSGVFFSINLAVPLAASLTLLVAFLVCFLAVLACNGWLLLAQSNAELSNTEVQLARAAALAAVFSLPLVATDFREEIGSIPVRLGALGPLVLIYVLLHRTSASGASTNIFSGMLAVLSSAAILSLMFGIVTVGMDRDLTAAWLKGLPAAVAWVFLAAIVIQSRTLMSEARGQNFMRWLLHARLDSVNGMLSSLKKLPMAAEHIILRAEELTQYSMEQIFALTSQRREPLNINEARIWIRSRNPQRLDAAEQLMDLFHRHEMTHALLISQEPPLIVLLNIPHGPNLAVAEIRAGVIQRIARRLMTGAANGD